MTAARSCSTTEYANARQLASWVMRLGEHASVLSPEELADEVAERVELLAERHEGELELAAAATSGGRQPSQPDAPETRRETVIRPERFARLVTLASILIEAGRKGEELESAEVCERLQISDAELLEDINVLNVVNFGGGSYVLYAELRSDGKIEVDPEPYSDNFARPARLLPVEAKALVAAIDLIGDHLPDGALTPAREKIVAALGADPMDQGLHVAATQGDDSGIARVVSQAIVEQRLLKLEYYKANEDKFTEPSRRALRAGQRARGLVRGLVRSRPPTTCATSGSIASRPRRSPTSASSAAPRSIPPPTSRAGRAPERSRRPRRPASGYLPSAPAGRARSATVAAGARRRLGRRRARLRGDRLARSRGAQGGGRRGGARSAGRARRRPRRGREAASGPRLRRSPRDEGADSQRR